MNVEFYSNFDIEPKSKDFKTEVSIVDNDTFTVASCEQNSCCLNFASHKRPGGGYRSVIGTSMPIKTQEEDLFRRSNLPKIMDVPDVKKYYPLSGVQGLYCIATVNKDKNLKPIETFETGIITVPAVVNPVKEQYELVKEKIKLIFNIAHVKDHETLILGAWGCGIFGNDPEIISKLFCDYLTEFKGVFKKVIFAIPNSQSVNYKIFASTIEQYRKQEMH